MSEISSKIIVRLGMGSSKVSLTSFVADDGDASVADSTPNNCVRRRCHWRHAHLILSIYVV
jgi:hypothetical protein